VAVIRLAGLADHEALARLHHLSHTVSFAALASESWLRSRRLDRYADDWRRRLTALDADSGAWVLEDGGEIMGMVSVSTGFDRSASEDAGRVAELRALHVHPSRIGAGLGRRLVAHAVDFLRSRAFAAAYAGTIERNERMRRLLATTGWHLWRLEPGGAEGVPVAVYRIQLS